MSLGAELHNASYSYDNVAGGRDIIFHDPFTGERLHPNKVPGSIVEQPHLLAGLNHLAKLGHERGHKITIAGAQHSSDSEFDIAELHSMAGEHDAIFLEGVGHTSYHRKIVREVGEGKDSVPDDFTADKYQLMQLAAISGHRKLVTYADIPGDGTNYEAALIEWGDFARKMTMQAKYEHGETKKNLFRAALINIAGSTILREWHMLGSVGNSLNSAEQQGSRVDSSLMLIGTEHTRTLPQKLGLLGVTSTPTELTMHKQGVAATIDYEAFDFTTAVRDYRARVKPL